MPKTYDPQQGWIGSSECIDCDTVYLLIRLDGLELLDQVNEMAPHSGDQPSRSAPAPRRMRLSGWGVVLLGAFGLGGLLACILGAMALFVDREPEEGLGRPVVGSQTLPDGTLLVLEQVTVGQTHNFTFREPRHLSAYEWLMGTRLWEITEQHTTPQDVQMLWFTRWDPQTKEPLDFDWWLSSTAYFDDGWQIDDEDPGRRTKTAGSSSGLSGQRPFEKTPGGQYRLIVAHSTLPLVPPAVRSSKLRVHNVQGEVVAEFDVPNQTKSALASWTPEPLPATKSVGKIQVTLDRLAAQAGNPRAREGVASHVLTPHVQITPEYRVTRNGEPTPEWNQITVGLSDAAGNTASPWNCRLNPRDPVWKVQLDLYRNETAPFDPEDLAVLPAVDLPAENTATTAAEHRTLHGASIDLLSLGRGNVVYRNAFPARHSGSHSYGGRHANENFQVMSKVDGSNLTTTIDTKLSYLVFQIDALPAQYRWSVRVVDDQQRPIPTQSIQCGGLHFTFLQVPPDAKKITPTVIVHEGYRVEFFVPPPSVELKKP